MMRQPIKHCYWVVPGKLLAGEYPRNEDQASSVEKLQALERSGVSAFIDLTEEGELDSYAEMLQAATHHRFPIHDVSIPDSPETTKTILDTIDQLISQGKTVYVHCWGGVGRTGLIIGCWLARHGEGGKAAFNQLQQLWRKCPKSAYRNSPETEDQKHYILNWQEQKTGGQCATPLMRYQGCLVGLAVGDAVGTTVEFKAPGSFPPVTDMVGGGPFGLKPGEWTDDTSMALCLAKSLLKHQGFDAKDQIDRYIRWWRDGYMSSNGTCFDIGNTVSQALRRYQKTGNPFAGSTDAGSAGNGSLMRLAPVPLFFASNPENAISMSAESSRTTHGALACLDACRYFGGLLVGAAQGVTKEELLGPRYSPIAGFFDSRPLCPEIDAVAGGSFKKKEPPQIKGTGYVVHSLEAALWAFHKTENFKDGCLLAVNLGNDADTTAAIYGQIAGAHYGIGGIPLGWRQRLADQEAINAMARDLYEAANC